MSRRRTVTRDQKRQQAIASVAVWAMLNSIAHVKRPHTDETLCGKPLAAATMANATAKPPARTCRDCVAYVCLGLFGHSI